MTGASLVINETGADGSLAGYTLDLDGGGPFQMLANFPRIVARLTSGTHTVALSGVPANCTVSGAPQRQFTVTARTLTTVAFNVTCAAYTGSIELRATTTGGDLDGDGYRARVDGPLRSCWSRNVGLAGEVLGQLGGRSARARRAGQHRLSKGASRRSHHGGVGPDAHGSGVVDTPPRAGR